MLILLFIVIPFLSFSNETKIILILIGIYQISYSIIDGLSAVFIAYEKMHIAAIIEMTLKILTTSSAVIIILLFGNIVLALLMLPIMSFTATFNYKHSWQRKKSVK